MAAAFGIVSWQYLGVFLGWFFWRLCLPCISLGLFRLLGVCTRIGVRKRPALRPAFGILGFPGCVPGFYTR